MSISLRTLAREWAIKILYQREINHEDLHYALEPAMDRLRREFVMRGSRRASGSLREEIALEWFTLHIAPLLPVQDTETVQVLAEAAGKLVQEMAYWQEYRTNKSLATAFPAAVQTPGLPALVSEQALLRSFQALEEQPQTNILRLLIEARPALQELFTPAQRAEARKFVKEAKEACLPAQAEKLLEMRSSCMLQTQNAWKQAAEMVRQNVQDWLTTASYCLLLIQGVEDHKEQLDADISGVASGWPLERQALVDRNILRIALWELQNAADVPQAVAVNEAVELAKKYSTAESGRFVNGVLGALIAPAAAVTAGNEKRA